MERKFPELKPLFIERIQKLLPDKKDFQDYLDILKIPPVRSIRCNKLKISPKELKKKLEDKGWEIKQPYKDYPEVMIVEKDNRSVISIGGSKRNRITEQEGKIQENRLGCLEPGELGRALEHLLGYYYIQELASMLPVIALNPKENETILDLCSAPGSKTTQLASELNNSGTIIANEVSMGRLKILASNLERCGVTNTIISRKDGIALYNRIKKYMPDLKFDKILVDAPCSGEGTLRSSLKTYAMWNIKTIQNLPRIQKQLVLSAFEILEPNGTLIYSTCTHAPEENEAVVDAILKELKNKIKLEKISLPMKFREGITEWENKEYSKEVKKCARIYPQDNNTEGFFIARFRKK